MLSQHTLLEDGFIVDLGLCKIRSRKKPLWIMGKIAANKMAQLRMVPWHWDSSNLLIRR